MTENAILYRIRPVGTGLNSRNFTKRPGFWVLFLTVTDRQATSHAPDRGADGRCLHLDSDTSGFCASPVGGRLARVAKLSVVVITLNEASNINAALKSVSWADEIVVVDSGSTDDTVKLARCHTDRISHRRWTGYGAQKDYATHLASHDWVLSLDADERISTDLANEIQALLAEQPRCNGYRLPRTTRYLGRWIRTTDWYPDYQLRLYDRRAASWSRDAVHESVQVTGQVGQLQHEIQHYAYSDLSSHLATIDRYTTLAATQWLNEGRRARLIDLVLHPAAAFLRNYLLRLGCVQGIPGLVVSLMNTHYVFLKHAKLWEQRQRRREQ